MIAGRRSPDWREDVRNLRWRDVTLEIKSDGTVLISIAVQGKTSGRRHIVEYISIDDAAILWSQFIFHNDF